MADIAALQLYQELARRGTRADGGVATEFRARIDRALPMLKRTLEAIARYFPHYTDHALTHSLRIVQNIGDVLLERRQFRRDRDEEVLSDLDLFLLIAAALVHDIGMVVAENELPTLRRDPDFRRHVEAWIAANRDDAVRDWWRDGVPRMAVADFIRARHPDRSLAFCLDQHAPVMKNLTGGAPALAKLLGEIAAGHGMLFEQIKSFPARTQVGLDTGLNATCNPRFIALCLRLGDLLDIGTARTCQQLRALAEPLPSTSEPHWDQYKDLRLIQPEDWSRAYKLVGSCPTHRAHEELRRWCGWLSTEAQQAAELQRAQPKPQYRLDIGPFDFAVTGPGDSPDPTAPTAARPTGRPTPRPTSTPVAFEGPSGAAARNVQGFVGRDAAMEALCGALADGDGPVVVAGVAGVGKTALVRHFVASAARDLFPDGVAWIDAATLAVDATRVVQRFGDAARPLGSLDQLRHQLAGALRERRALLVIDNVTRPLVADLPIVRGRSRTVLLARDPSIRLELDEDLPLVELGRWSLPECREYLRETARRLRNAADEELDRLAIFVGRLPLAMRLLAKRLARPDQTPRHLLERLTHDATDALDVEANGLDRGVAAVFAESFDALDDAARRVLLALASCARTTRAEVVAAVADLPVDRTELCLADLSLAEPFVEFTEASARPFGLHDLVRLFVRRHHRDASADADAAHLAFARRLIRDYRAGDDDDPDELSPGEPDQVELDLSEVLTATDRCIEREQGPAAWALLTPISRLLKRGGRYIDLVSRCERVAGLLPQRGLDRSAVLNRLGLSYRSLGRTADAIRYHNDGLEICTDITRAPERSDEERRAGERLAVKHLGNLGLCVRGRDLKSAIDFHKQALAIHVRLHNEAGQARQLGNLGLCHRLLGETERAIVYHKGSLELHERLARAKLGERARQRELAGRAAQLNNLGNCHFELGQIAETFDFFADALEIYKQLNYPEAVADQLNALARSYLKTGEIVRAKRLCEEALALERSLGRRGGEARSLTNLGRCHHASGELDHAIRSHEMALEIYRQILDDLGEAEQHGELGKCRAALGQRDAARASLNRSLELWRALGVRESRAAVAEVQATLDDL